ncbi:hypothetical protein BV898_17688 [Hypsibius exemplaris]|uniref:Uncharacterized protein n=1 Tax=Hypsibius exemplaris TaxID=2072580 RepID=A0A9X6RMD9_HYPEX|nr:hypothetical protein BV898_17688 [Hypsibius exemplaris]
MEKYVIWIVSIGLGIMMTFQQVNGLPVLTNGGDSYQDAPAKRQLDRAAKRSIPSKQQSVARMEQQKTPTGLSRPDETWRDWLLVRPEDAYWMSTGYDYPAVTAEEP